MVDFSELKQKYPRISDLTPADFDRMSVDRQMNDFWREEEAYRRSQATKNFIPSLDTPDPKIDLKVPSINRPEVSAYRATTPYRTYPNGSYTAPSRLNFPGGLADGLSHRPLGVGPQPPSGAHPPLTPRTSGAAPNANTTMQAPPSTGQPKASNWRWFSSGGSSGGGATPPPAPSSGGIGIAADPRPAARPPNVPSSSAGEMSRVQMGLRNAAVGGSAIVATDLTYRLVTGTPITADSIGRTLAVAAGSTAGAAIGTAIGGPIGGWIGGAVGGGIGMGLYDRFFHPTTAQPQKESYIGLPAFKGGQSAVPYFAVGSCIWMQQSYGYSRFAVGSTVNWATQVEILGPISSAAMQVNTGGAVNFIFYHPDGRQPTVRTAHNALDGESGGSRMFYYSDTPVSNNQDTGKNFTLVKFRRKDGQPDIGGDPAPMPPVADNRTFISIYHPGNQAYAPPRAVPQESPNTAPNNYAPGGLPAIKLPHARPAGSEHPDTAAPPMLLPGFKGAGDSVTSGAPSNNATNNPLGGSMTVNPETGAVRIVAPGSAATNNPALNSWDSALPAGFTPAFTPNPLESNPITPTGFTSTVNPDHMTSSGLGTTVKAAPQPDAVNPIPKPKPASSTATTTAPATAPAVEQLQKQFDDMQRQVIQTGLTLAGITTIVQQIANNTTREAIETASAAGTCRTTQTGGCTSNLVNDAASNINQNTNNALRGLDAAAQLEQLRLLGVIDNKLGAQVPGGISNLLTKTKDRINKVGEFLQIDRLLNILIWWQTLHNAFMLSNNLSTTLTSALSQALAALPGNSLFGIPTEEEGGSPLDIGAQINGMFENAVKSAIGADNYTSIKATWAKANRIYQSAANVVFSVQSLIQGVQSIAEATGENVGKVGNALKSFGVVGEKAYNWMSERMNVKTAWMQKLESSLESGSNMSSNLESIVSDVASTTQTISELQTQAYEFDNALKDITKSSRADNTVVKAKTDADKTVSQSPDIAPKDLEKADSDSTT